MRYLSKAVLIICLFSSFFLIAQKEVYVDENMTEIDSQTYLKKCEARVLGCLQYRTNALTVYKIYKHHDFGKINLEDHSQISLLSEVNNNINDQTIILHFKDSIFGYYESEIKELKNSKKIKFDQLTTSAKNSLYKQAQIDAQSNIKSHFNHVNKSNEKCVRFLEKRNAKDFWVYNEDINYIEKFGAQKKWIKNNALLDRLFFTKYPNASYVIIKPNGNYFISDRYISKSNYSQLIRNSDWTDLEQDLEHSIKKISKSGIGFFYKKDLIANNDCIIEY